MELKDYFTVFKRRWPIGLLLGLTVVGLGIWHTWTRQVAVFTAQAKIVLRYDRAPRVPDDYLQFLDTTGYSLATKEELLKSSDLQHWAAAIYLLVTDEKYSASELKDLKAVSDDTIVEFLVREKILIRTAESDEHFTDTPPLRDRLEAARDLIRSSVSIDRPDQKTQIAHIIARAGTRSTAQLIAQTYAKAAEVYSKREARKILRQVTASLEGHVRTLEEMKKSLRDRIKEAGQLEPEQVKDLERQAAVIETDLAALDRQRGDAELREQQVRSRLDHLTAHAHIVRTPIGTLPLDLPSSRLLDDLRQQHVRVSAELAAKSLRMTTENPEYQSLRKTLEHLEEQIRQEESRLLSAEIVRLVDERDRIQRELKALQDRRQEKIVAHQATKDRISKILPILRDLEAREKELERANSQLQTFQSALKVQQGFFEYHEPPAGAVAFGAAPVQQYLIFGVLGLVVFFGTCFLLEYLDTKIHTDADLRKHLNVEVLGIVKKCRSSESLLTGTALKSPISEMYNTLAAIVRRRLAEDGLKSVAMTSAVPEEGKTTLSVNIAVALARGNSRVLLIDGDLRKSALHKIFNLDNSTGLTTALQAEAGGTDPGQFAQQTPIDNLYVVTSGPSDESPIRLLESGGMKRLLERMKEQFDFVIVDTPPVLNVADALVVAASSDATILVARSGKVDRRSLNWAKHLLENVHANVIGCALNFAPVERSVEYYYYYYYYGGTQKSIHTRE